MMGLADLLQFVANAIVLLLSIDVLRAMRRDSSQLRGAVFIFLAIAGAVGMLAAVSRVTDANADTLLALGVAMLLLVGCRPVRRT